MQIAFFIMATLLISSCSTTPTGRRQVNLIPDGQMTQLGAKSFAEMKRKEKLSTNQKYIGVTHCVVNELLTHNGFNPKEWEVQVFADQSVNAFALPGKKIGVHEGLFKAAKSADQLAAVIGHEIGHVLAEHGNERVSQQLLVQGGLTLADLAVDQQTTKGKAIMLGLGLGASLGVILPYSRKHELEADELGLTYMAKSGFEPNEAVELWKNMAKEAGKNPPQFLSTHPNPDKRISDIRKRLSAAKKIQAHAIEAHGAPECQI